jgi:glycosyltransferase involved in cell wall biosynthesis
MSRRQEPSTSALDRRFDVICKSLGLSYSPGQDRYAAFVQTVITTPQLRPHREYLFAKLFLGKSRFGSTHDLSPGGDDPHRLSEILLRLSDAADSSEADVVFEHIEAGHVFIDVTHTYNFPYHSGIQRVVRCLVEQFRDLGFQFRLIKYDPALNEYCLLNDSDVALFYGWRKLLAAGAPPRGSAAFGRLLTPIGSRVRKLLGRRLRNWCASATERLVKKVRGIAARQGHPPAVATGDQSVDEVVAPFVWGHTVFVPEVVLQPARLDAIHHLFRCGTCRAVMVVYDLIPLLNPEYCDAATVNFFLRYLRLLQDANGITCISHAVRADVLNYKALAQWTNEDQEIATNYLAGDTKLRRKRMNGRSANGRSPTVLVVGSITLRKNQHRVLQAMVSAQQQGAVFKGVFVGNLDAGSGPFLERVTSYRSEGHDLDVCLSASESELESLYEQAVLTIFCSLAEGFGLPIVESVERGLPCVVSNRGSMKEIAEQLGGCICVDPEDVESIARAIARFFQDEEFRCTIENAAKKATWPNWSDASRSIWNFITKKGVDAELTFSNS